MMSPRLSLALLLLCALAAGVQAFVPVSYQQQTSSRATFLGMLSPALPPAVTETVTIASTSTSTAATMASPLQQGVDSYMSRSSSMQVALEERKAPTKDEIEAKKRNFNVVFWGTCNLMSTLCYG
jgi:formylmethanofuran dehydrogenase subunit B